jgi:GNAT superfamily N-acetyltransferase
MRLTGKNMIIDTDNTKLDIDYIQRNLAESYWAENIPRHIVEKSIEGSLCFGMYSDDRQIGFARVVTDKATFGYLADVFIDKNYRGQGMGKWLMKTIMAHADLQGFRRFMLATRDAHGLYAQSGFVPLTSPERWMHIHKPAAYKDPG